MWHWDSVIIKEKNMIRYSITLIAVFGIAVLMAMTGRGGLLGGKFSLRTKPKSLKMIFAYTTFAAAVFFGNERFCQYCWIVRLIQSIF